MLFYKNTAFGLDIGDKSIKLIEIKKNKNLRGKTILKLSSFNEIKLDHNIIINGEIKNSPAVVNAIKNCLKGAKGSIINTRTVVSALPETHSYFKVISKPKNLKINLTDLVKKTMKQNFPLDDGHFYYSWQQTTGNKIAIAATPKNMTDSYTDVIEQAGLVPLALEPENISIARALVNKKRLNSKKAQIFMDIGASGSSLIAIHKQDILLTLHISLSGDAITNTIVKKHKLSFSEAEKIKEQCGRDLKKCPEKIKKTINETIISNLKQVKSEINYVNRLLPNKVDKIYISGGVAQMSKITSILSKKLKIKVRHADPKVNITINKKIKLSDEELLKYTTAIGLALRGTDNNLL